VGSSAIATWTSFLTRICHTISSSALLSGTYTPTSRASGMSKRSHGPLLEANKRSSRRASARTTVLSPPPLSSSASSAATSTRWNPAAAKQMVPATTMATKLVKKSSAAPPATPQLLVPRPKPLAHKGGTRDMPIDVPAAVDATSDAGRIVA
jgi:hypothetical protein